MFNNDNSTTKERHPKAPTGYGPPLSARELGEAKNITHCDVCNVYHKGRECSGVRATTKGYIPRFARKIER